MLRRIGQASEAAPEPAAAAVGFPALDQPFLLDERPPGVRFYKGRASFYHPYAVLQAMHLADDTLMLSFATAEVSVTGRGLHALYVHLSTQSVAAVIEQGERYAADPAAPVHVNRITETLN
jgi:hypothetical protein